MRRMQQARTTSNKLQTYTTTFNDKRRDRTTPFRQGGANQNTTKNKQRMENKCPSAARAAHNNASITTAEWVDPLLQRKPQNQHLNTTTMNNTMVRILNTPVLNRRTVPPACKRVCGVCARCGACLLQVQRQCRLGGNKEGGQVNGQAWHNVCLPRWEWARWHGSGVQQCAMPWARLVWPVAGRPQLLAMLAGRGCMPGWEVWVGACWAMWARWGCRGRAAV